jgi:hypothetical protein
MEPSKAKEGRHKKVLLSPEPAPPPCELILFINVQKILKFMTTLEDQDLQERVRIDFRKDFDREDFDLDRAYPFSEAYKARI